MNNSRPSSLDLQAMARQVMLAQGFEPDFPLETRQQLAEISAHPPQLAGSDKVRDLRGLLWSSIDNDTSRDLDQIEVAERQPNGDVRVMVGVSVGVGVTVGVSVGVPVPVIVGVRVAVDVGVAVGVMVGVLVGVEVGCVAVCVGVVVGKNGSESFATLFAVSSVNQRLPSAPLAIDLGLLLLPLGTV